MRTTILGVAAVLGILSVGSAANAQSISLGYSQFGHRSGFGFGIGLGVPSYGYYQPSYAPVAVGPTVVAAPTVVSSGPVAYAAPAVVAAPAPVVVPSVSIGIGGYYGGGYRGYYRPYYGPYRRW